MGLGISFSLRAVPRTCTSPIGRLRIGMQGVSATILNSRDTRKTLKQVQIPARIPSNNAPVGSESLLILQQNATQTGRSEQQHSGVPFPICKWRRISAGQWLARPCPHNYFVSIFRLMFTCGRVSNWLTVLVSLL